MKHLQSLVAMVQHSPGVADGLPDNLMELAASMDDTESQQDQDRNNASNSEGEMPQTSDRYIV